ncbi:MAG TPA: hypothetical protein VKF17_18265 [Isosphaeraceae bacterium]|nr:hypothetical protein [Isosphaeraceae bacterium]
MRTQKRSARRRKQVRELGRRLLYIAGPEEVKVGKQALWDDDPELLVGELEETAEGCRRLLERWTEDHNLLAGYDSNRVIENSTNVNIGILSHEGTDAADRPGQGDGGGQCLSGDVTTPPKAPNKANLESEQSPESQVLKLETTGAEWRKQSQSSRGETRRKPTSRDGRLARKSGRRPVASEAEGSELLRAAGVPPLRRPDDLDSPSDGQMKSRTYRVTLADLTKSTAFRTKEDLQRAAQFIGRSGRPPRLPC